MAETKYSYIISTAFPNGKVAPDRLTDEIQNSAIVIALDRIDVSDSADSCDVWFKGELSIDDQTLLDGLVAAHSGESLAALPTDVVINGARFDLDGKQVVVPTPAPRGSYTWYTSCGDALTPEIVRGGGTPARITFNAEETGTKTAELHFSEAVYIHDGEINWSSPSEFDGTDLFSVYIKFGVTTVTENIGGTGNCNLYNGYVIIPAAGDGAYDVDLTTAHPVPSSSGPWVVNEKTEEISIFVEGSIRQKFEQHIVLLTVEPPTFYLVRNVSLGSPRGIFEIDAYLVEWISKHWVAGLEVVKTKVPTTIVEVNGVLMLFRWNATVS
jgi:hypothetical protein